MQSRGLTRSGFRWRPTNFGGPLQLIWRTQPTGSKTPGGAGTHTGHTGAHGHTTDHAQTTVSGVPRLPQGSHRLNRSHGTNQLQTTLSAVRCAAERCLDDDVLFRIPAMRGLPHHPPSYRPPDVCQSSPQGGGAQARAHTARCTHTLTQRDPQKLTTLHACMRETHSSHCNQLHPLWSKTAMEGPRRTSSKPRRAIAGVAARSPCGAHLTLRWHAKKVTASARSPWRSPHSSMASANEDCCRPCNRAPLSPDSNLRASSYVVIASMYLLSP
jgi:hypothetical protein